MDKIRVVAKIERDVRNLFFVKMLYALIDLPDNLCTAYEIKDRELLTNVINMTQAVVNEVDAYFFEENNVVGYNVIQKHCMGHFYVAGRIVRNVVIAGTLSQENFKEINNLLGLISNVITRENLGIFSVQYNGKNMSCNEFYSFQQNLSLY